MRAANVLDEVVRVATNWKNDGQLTHPRTDYVDFVRGKALLMSGSRKYSVTVLAGVTGTGNVIFHDIVDVQPDSFTIKKSKIPTADTAKNSPHAILGISDGFSLSQPIANVKKKDIFGFMDVDLDAATISVNKSVSMVDGHPHVKKGGKTANATRTVNIPPQLVRYLRPLLRARSPFDLVCTDKRGRMLSESAFSRMWESYLCDLNFKYGKFSKQPKSKFQPGGVPFVIPHITPHMLRHTCATNMVLAGMDAITVKDQLGHANIQTTLDIYTHVTAEHKKNEIDKLEKYLASRSIG